MDRPRSARTRPSRRGVAAALTGALVAGSLGVVLSVSLSRLDLSPACGRDGAVLRMPDGSRACVHADEAPPGVDETEDVSTSELRTRVGAGPAAYQAAQELGVAAAPAAAAASPEVPCDGDGSSGYRVQALYVVEAGHSNRYGALLESLQRWASGVDDVVNRSAALTGGVRHLRYVTDPGATAGTCVADVANVTVPDGSMTSFNATIQAVQAQGYTDPTRKYLMWTDASSLCGIASMYLSDGSAQGNPNNGSYPQYARVDSGCWGFGDGAAQHSVEAHELVHTLGAVQSSAPHATQAGHCWDESDTMCYPDGTSHPMVQVCPGEREYLLDCNSDDYFSTYPDPGAYLDTHWNAAASRFLVGGGDGTGGGSTGSPTVLGARVSVNNPAVPGLATQATVTPALPAGRTLDTVLWRSPRRDCVFADPTAVQSTVTCSASLPTATTVTVTVRDSSGAVKTVSSPLTFATGGSRPLALTLSVAGQSSAEVDSASMCTGAATPVSAVLTDVQTGQPVKGLTAVFSRRTATQASSTAAGRAVSDGSGRATVLQASTGAVTYGARAAASAGYAAADPVILPATVEKCAPDLTGTATGLDVYYGDPVTVSGTLTRDAGGATVPLGGVGLPVRVVSTSTVSGRTSVRTTVVGTARTGLDGSYSLDVRPTVSGELSVALPASASWTGATVPLGDLTVSTPSTDLTASIDRTDVGYGGPVVVTGTLQRVAGGSTTGAAAQTVSLRLTAPGRAPSTVGTARTAPDGSFKVTAPLRVAGALSLVYARTAALPGATQELGDATVGIWATSLTASPSSTASARAGTQVSISGTLTRSYAGSDEPARSVPVRLFARADGSDRDVVVPGTTGPSGAFAFRVAPRVGTTYQVRVLGVTGYQDAESGPMTIAVG